MNNEIWDDHVLSSLNDRILGARIMANGFGPQGDRPNESTEETGSGKHPDDESVDGAGSCLEVEEQAVRDYGDTSKDSIDRETQLDCSVLQYFESEFSSQVPDQLSVHSCYGRGKGLADISLPRLPKKLQDDSYLGSSARSDNVDQLVLQSQMNKVLNPGCGRGMMLQMQFNYLDEKEVRPGQNAVEESPQAASPAKSSRSIYDDNFDFDIYYTKPAKRKSYNVKCLDEFPSLIQQSSAESKPQILCNNTKTNIQVRQRSRQNVFKPTEAFEDVEVELDGTHHKSQTLNVPSCKEETSAYVDSSLAETMCYKEMREKESQNDSYSANAIVNSEETNLEVHCPNSHALKEVEKHKDEACDSVQKFYVENDNCKNDLNPHNAVEISEDLTHDVTGLNSDVLNATSQREEASDNTDDADNTCSSNIPSELDKSQESFNLTTVADVQTSSSIASAGVPEDKQGKEDASQSAENMDNSQARNSILRVEYEVASKPKKKPAGAWKLEGPGVVHVENVPKGCGEELRMHLAGFGKIVDKEKKSQKRANIWRFKFEDADKCVYAISCMDGFDLFEGSLPPLACRHLGQT